MKLIEPETKVAFLPSAGLDYRRATKHVYSHTARVTVVVNGTNTSAYVHMFKCDETGQLRRWGCDGAFSN